MNNLKEIIFGAVLYGAGIFSGFAHWYEFHACSDKYARKDAKRRISKGLPIYELPSDGYEDGQYYFKFMKDYV